MKLCECGCGEKVSKIGNRFINGHNRRGKKFSLDPRLKMVNKGKNNPMYGVTQSPEILKKKGRTISKIHLTEKEPLSDGWDSKVLTTNENCSVYFGNIGEQIVSEMYPDVQVMPTQSPGYDLIYNHKKIDVKSAFTGDKNGVWIFYIDKNTKADYFLCLAFNNQKDHTLVHAWLIPGNIANRKDTVTMSKSNIKRFPKYKQSTNDLLKPLRF